MNSKLFVALGCVAFMAGLSGQASAACLPTGGRIVTNMQPPDGGTLGVVTLRLGMRWMKCAIIGIPVGTPTNGFEHTIVCEDPPTGKSALAQISFNSTITALQPLQACPPGSPAGPASFSFAETATAIPATGRGFFARATSGAITIYGRSACDGAVSMHFQGSMCFAD